MKKTLTAVLSAALLVSLAACSSDNEPSAAPSTTSEASASPTQSTASEGADGSSASPSASEDSSASESEISAKVVDGGLVITAGSDGATATMPIPDGWELSSQEAGGQKVVLPAGASSDKPGPMIAVSGGKMPDTSVTAMSTAADSMAKSMELTSPSAAAPIEIGGVQGVEVSGTHSDSDGSFDVRIVFLPLSSGSALLTVSIAPTGDQATIDLQAKAVDGIHMS